MELIQEDAEALAEKLNWFSPGIENNPWVVYHATSSIAEELIDRDGFQCGSTELNDAVLLCLSIMETVDWWEDAAVGTLKAYSLPRTRGAAPFFCALYPQRTCLYTGRSLAGGETAYALRRIIPKLVQVSFDNPDFFDRRFELDRKKCISEASRGIFMHRSVLKVNLVWLREKVTALKAFLPRLLAMREQHRYGIVYALRLDRSDLSATAYSWSDGLRIYHPLPASKCVGKLIVCGEHDLNSHANPSWNSDNQWRRDSELAKLASQNRHKVNLAEPIDHKEFIDPEGAVDLRYQLMVQYGDDALRKIAAKAEEMQRQMILNAKRARALP